MAECFKIDQRHGKSRVRVARVWRPHNRSSDISSGGGHVIVEWEVDISLFSDCLPSYTSDDNSDIVATDTVKNTVNSFPCKQRPSLPDI
jgi:urate oxidase